MSTPSWITPGQLIAIPYHHGTLSGSLAVAAGGSELPVRRRVWIYAEHGHGPGNLMPVRLAPVADVMPDANGLWTARNLDPARLYTAVSHDPTGEHAPTIQAGLQATVEGEE